MKFADLPALGAPLDGGTFCGITTLQDGSHAAVILLPAKPTGCLSWQAATDWAKEAGGQLPTRLIAAMLYANAKDQFEPRWYWTSGTLDGDTSDYDDAACAWHCYFGDGNQDYDRKSAEGAAVAVRLINLE